MDFKKFKQAIARQFGKMSERELFRVTVDKDLMWKTYLESFPAGTNPLFRERSEHDCSCCRQFVRAVGDVVTIIDGKLVSVWDVTVDEPGYQAVTEKMRELIYSHPIENIFLHFEATAGTDKNFEDLTDGVKTWEHFFVHVPPKFVKKNAEQGPVLSDARAKHDVLLRGLKEITLESVDTILELIAQNSLYRGEEKKALVQAFKKLKGEFDSIPFTNEVDYTASEDLFAWSKVSSKEAWVCGFRNDVVGTLAVDISEGKDLELAVKAWETKMAPANYKRPTALVTKAQIEQAKKTVEELGLTSALERRYASLSDVPINDVLFADRSAKKLMGGGVFDDLAPTKSAGAKSFDKVEEVNIEKFIADILPKATSLELMVENRHEANLVSLVAPADPTARQLFKWPNGFSWSYNGDIADSEMRRAVVARGGSVTGVFRFTHMWNYGKRNASLMDLHVFMPGSKASPENGVHDNYGNEERVGWNHRKHTRSGGVQDVDYTAAAPEGYVPVENITFPDLSRMPEGKYVCKIHNWQLRQPTQGGFKAEIEFGGTVYQYEVDRPLKHKEWVTVAEVTLKNGVFTIEHHLPVGSAPKTVWNVQTEHFHKVNVVCLSPNHWGGQGVGNKHYFFMLDQCRNDGTARGFFNEFLRGDLEQHRKVLEMVGAKMKTEKSNDQLSGLGFSSTQRNSALCKVKGASTRTIRITF